MQRYVFIMKPRIDGEIPLYYAAHGLGSTRRLEIAGRYTEAEMRKHMADGAGDGWGHKSNGKWRPVKE